MKKSMWRNLSLSFFLTPFIFVSAKSDAASSEDTLKVFDTHVEHVRTLPGSQFDYDSHDYYTSLLRLALSKTESEYGKAKLTFTKERLVQSRIMKELEGKGGIDVFWTVTSKERETTAIPVRVPLLNGIMGLRVSLVLEENLSNFTVLNKGNSLTEMVAGQGHDWPDYEILHSNGFLVLGTSTYDLLVELLKKERIDYFPRALNEAIVEQKALKNKGIVIEPNYVLYYPSYIFFFVSKAKPELASRIEKGLKIAVEDGSFLKLFKSYVDTEHLNNELDLANRTMLRLQNPLLSEETTALSTSFDAMRYLLSAYK
ncbi:hypothetical protein [Alteromonas sp. S167]|uniref:hypothetical protein n=1 Tax=Alteromonas sp. S167 TaxID=3117402 RepID=UPI002FE3E1B1